MKQTANVRISIGLQRKNINKRSRTLEMKIPHMQFFHSPIWLSANCIGTRYLFISLIEQQHNMIYARQ